MTRLFRRFVAKLGIAALLFMQMAVAAYACPHLQAGSDAAEPQRFATAHEAQARGCVEIDATAPHLCLQHCQQGSQASDSGGPIVLPAVALLPVVWVDSSVPGVEPGDQRELLARATTPPPSIRFCVLRT